jgi:hypothetical protein
LSGARKTDGCNTSNQVGTASPEKVAVFMNCGCLDFIRLIAQNAQSQKE